MDLRKNDELLIMINADDFGWSQSCSNAIIESFQKGFITTTTACANGDFFMSAAQKILTTKYKNNVGIHLNITEGQPLTQGIKRFDMFCNENGEFNKEFSRIGCFSKEIQQAIFEEFSAQVEFFLSSGLKIHHADSHHHIHNAPNVFPIFMKVINKYKIHYVRKLRNVGSISSFKMLYKNIINGYLAFSGHNYAKYFGSFEDYCNSNKDTGVFEIMVHPDYQDTTVVDRAPSAPYDAPYGLEMESILNKIVGRKHKIVY